MSTRTYPIVGMQYRKPSDIFVKILGVGTKLYLIAEPFHKIDPNAIAVWVDLDHARENPAIETQLSREEYLPWIGMSSVQLGYLPRDVAKYLKIKGFPNEGEVEATFHYTFGSNLPHARFEFE